MSSISNRVKGRMINVHMAQFSDITVLSDKVGCPEVVVWLRALTTVSRMTLLFYMISNWGTEPEWREEWLVAIGKIDPSDKQIHHSCGSPPLTITVCSSHLITALYFFFLLSADISHAYPYLISLVHVILWSFISTLLSGMVWYW